MPGEYLLDTSVIIPLFRGEPAVQERLEKAQRVFLSAVVLGELHFGAEGSDRTAEQIDQIQVLDSIRLRRIGLRSVASAEELSG